MHHTDPGRYLEDNPNHHIKGRLRGKVQFKITADELQLAEWKTLCDSRTKKK